MASSKKDRKRMGSASRDAGNASTGIRPIATEPSRVGKRGSLVIPAALRRRYGIEEGSIVVAEAHEAGILIRPAMVLPIDPLPPER
ncbi:AbrB/MazE/SpoVT family DNA-binding domain-containing protein [Tautonia marina]|uniref:AbrB/MazE/SpoVT family DNA-binding domain-containing protein n=1 Tax=Tautonia marina TaxID=2653855 RepID=UPI0012609500|nr:AbrB/MazE/SpoVT family DNA-binding domain-containing protein [Tautonia marina]